MVATTMRGKQTKGQWLRADKKKNPISESGSQGSAVSTAAKLQSFIASKHPTGSMINTEMHFSVHHVNAIKMIITFFSYTGKSSTIRQ